MKCLLFIHCGLSLELAGVSRLFYEVGEVGAAYLAAVRPPIVFAVKQFVQYVETGFTAYEKFAALFQPLLEI